VFVSRLGGFEGLRRALAAWALARDTLEGTLRSQKVEEGACRKGCAWCCRLEVEVRFAEAMHLARRARQNPKLEAHVRATAARLAGLDATTHLRAAIPCAFLDQASGACLVYADRPLACRSYRSRDAGWCRSIVGTSGGVVRGGPVIRDGLAIRGLIERALDAVTPPAWRGKGELHALVVHVLEGVRPAAPDPLETSAPAASR
jgi:Fe-S-cluster containining protein